MMKKALVAALITALAALAPISAIAMETPSEYASSVEEAVEENATKKDENSNGNADENTTENDVNSGGKTDENATEKDATSDGKADENTTENDATSDGKEDENTTENDINSDGKVDENTAKNDATSGGKADEISDEGSDDVASGATGFEAFYALVMEHLSEILSLCAFAASLVCAAVYKSGLLPLIERSLNAIGNTTQKIRESAELGEDKRRADIDALSEKLNTLEASLGELAEKLLDCTERMEEKSITSARERRMETLISGELEMLYDIFMSSALPEYEKVRVGERVAKMKEVISSNEKD